MAGPPLYMEGIVRHWHGRATTVTYLPDGTLLRCVAEEELAVLRPDNALGAAEAKVLSKAIWATLMNA